MNRGQLEWMWPGRGPGVSVSIEAIYPPLSTYRISAFSPRCFTVLFLQQIPPCFRLEEWPSALSPLSSDGDTGRSAKVDTLS